MKNLYKYSLSTLILSFAFTLVSTKTYALIPLKIDPGKFKLDPKVVSCSIIGSKYSDKLAAFEKSESKHTEIYTKLIDRLETMSAKWGDWGYNVSEISLDIKTLKEKVQEYKDDIDDLQAKVSEAKAACGSANYGDKLSSARQALTEVRKDVVDIRVFYQTEIRKDIVALKKQEIK